MTTAANVNRKTIDSIRKTGPMLYQSYQGSGRYFILWDIVDPRG